MLINSMTATAGIRVTHAGYIGHSRKPAMIRPVPATIDLEDERTCALAVYEQPGTPPFSCTCTPYYYDRTLLNRPNFWLS